MIKITGLTNKEVEQRIEKNLINHDTSVPTKTIKKILFDNFFTLFNFLNIFLGIAVFLVGSYKNMLFLGVIILNTAISTIQEIHSKRIIDNLSIMANSKVNVIRDGNIKQISIDELVLDDVIEFKTGNQIPTDCLILEGDILIDESFITGESDTISKKKGDTILSGSFIVSGKCFAKVIHICEENYTAKISNGAKYVKKINSEIITSLRKIIKFLSIIIIPIGIALFSSQLQIPENTFTDSVVKTVAALIGMIPEGLVLLTSTVLAVSVIKLSKSKVLVQELYCIETLARVDTLCIDKTGTLTEGNMEIKKIISIDDNNSNDIENILANFAKFSEDENSTIESIRNKFKKIKIKFNPIKKIPFSSISKWSGIYFENEGSYILGSPEFVLKDNYEIYKNIINKYSKDYRVIVLAHSNKNFEKKNLPLNIKPLALILILDKIRKEASNTIKYFYEQSVDIKIISGDNPITVSKIAKHVGIKNYNKYIDMSTLKDSTDFKELVSKFTVFGRVSPTQKKELIVALQENNKTVAMTGDGVNDVLALKASDCSIAMAKGSDAAKSVSQLVLLDSNFASMPKVVAEGRKTINNIERSASLFLVKTIYSTILSILFLILNEQYPFVPIQLTFMSVITIGIPSFILALEPNKEKISGNFLKNIITRALPTGLAIVLNIFTITILNKFCIIPQEYASSLCVISTGICGIILLFTLSKTRKSENTKIPFSIFRLTLTLLLTCLFIIGLTVFGNVFGIVPIIPILKPVITLILTSLMNFIILTIILKILLK